MIEFKDNKPFEKNVLLSRKYYQALDISILNINLLINIYKCC